MNDIRKALHISRSLDTQRRARGDEPPGQRRVDAALTGGEGAPWETPSPDLHRRILDALSLSGTSPIPLELPRLRPTPWGSLAAAAAFLVGGAGLVVALRSLPPAPAVLQRSVVVSPSESSHRTAFTPRTVSAFDEAGALPRRTEQVVAASVEAPLVRETKRVRTDAVRAVEMVLSRMPVGDR